MPEADVSPASAAERALREVLRELGAASGAGFTGSIEIDFHGGVAQRMRTRSVRRLGGRARAKVDGSGASAQIRGE